MLRIFRFSIAAAILSSACACAFVESQSGLLLKSDSNVPDVMSGTDEYPKAYGNRGEIWLKDLPLTIKSNRPAEDDVLFFGPGFLIPIPVIPWPPGIISRFISKDRDDSQENVEVILTFAHLWGYWQRRGPPDPDIDFSFDLKDATLNTATETVVASSATYVVRQRALIPLPRGGAVFGGEVPDPYANEYGLENGRFNIRVSSGYVRSTDIHLVFPVKYMDINGATLEIRNLRTPAGSRNVPPIRLENKRQLKFDWIYTINT